MLDVHILVMPETPREFVGQCIASVVEASGAAPFPVHVHVLPGVDGHVGMARQAGYQLGCQPYVTFVDDDDYVLPNAFSCLADALRESPPAIFTREIQEQNGMQWECKERHHLAAYRRDVLSGFDFEAHPYYVDVEMAKKADKLGAIDVMEHVYVHRVRLNSSARLLRRKLHRG